MLKKFYQKYQNMSLPLKASHWFVICGVSKTIADVLVTPIFTRILTTEQYGYFDVYNSWFQIVKIIFTLYLFSEVFNVGLANLIIMITLFLVFTILCSLLYKSLIVMLALVGVLLILMGDIDKVCRQNHKNILFLT